MSQASDRRELIDSLSDRERDLAGALARVTYKLHVEFERSESDRPARERMTWPQCWAEAQDGWETLVRYGLVDKRRRPHVPPELSKIHTR